MSSEGKRSDRLNSINEENSNYTADFDDADADGMIIEENLHFGSDFDEDDERKLSSAMLSSRNTIMRPIAEEDAESSDEEHSNIVVEQVGYKRKKKNF